LGERKNEAPQNRLHNSCINHHRVRECFLRNMLWCLSSKYKSRGDQPYIPPTKPYEFSQLASDLVVLARYLLKTGGRLVFFLPTVTDEYEIVDIESMLCDGMEVIANSLQDFGSWGRRVSYISGLQPFIRDLGV
jgi:hypothetical protein